MAFFFLLILDKIISFLLETYWEIIASVNVYSVFSKFNIFAGISESYDQLITF